MVLSASRTELIPVFTGLSERQFRRLVTTVARRRTNLTMRRVAPACSGSNRPPCTASSTASRRSSPWPQSCAGTHPRRSSSSTALIPVRDQALTARSKNYRNWVNVQVVIDADTQLLIAVGDPKPGKRNDCTVYEDSDAAWTTRGATVIADGAYRGPRATGAAHAARGIAYMHNLTATV
ncbi:transposase [Cryptosporangium phraense]|uniref:Transposase n=1 Tax=Cryptosporangium phraense TaxID=2593070 RepID=A0A545AEF0_9ACTN|nr:transposase [Cryptosporangium phraense]TQS39689.1 transposase [Cryptosporangium phraense]